MAIQSLSELIEVDERFKNSINLQLDLKKADRALGYIPTKPSVAILKSYLSSIIGNREKATVLIGPYGKGKSHLLLVLLTILTLDRNDYNEKIVLKIADSIKEVDDSVAKTIIEIWESNKKFLPIIISSTQGDLNQAFLLGLNDAIKTAGLLDIIPETYYTEAVKIIRQWENEYKETYEKFKKRISEEHIGYKEFISNLIMCNKNALDLFKEIYPDLTSGSQFNPLVNTEILNLYKNINDIICTEYGFGGIYIVFDEFSKFIESHDKNAVSNDMKILQDVCELSTDSSENQIHITLVTHKSIKEYGNVLSHTIINAFTGIEGRIQERFFVSSSKNNYELIQNAINKDSVKLEELEKQEDVFKQKYIDSCYSIPAFKAMFKYEDFENIVARGCFPLTPVSAYILLNISEKVAQNERTLFTFISKNEPLSMANYIKKHISEKGWYIGAEVIYDYFKNIFRKDIANVSVHSEWLKAEYALSQVKKPECKKMIKVLALLNIINKPNEMPSISEILSLGICIRNNGQEILDELSENQLIYKKSSTGYFVFKSSVGADLKKEIKKARTLLGDNVNICKTISQASEIDYVVPKQHNQIHSMTRYFDYKFMHYEGFLKIAKSDYLFDEKFADGCIIRLICNENEIELNNKRIEEKLEQLSDERIIVLKPKNFYDINQILKDYIIIQDMKSNKTFLDENKVLINELDIYEEDITFDIERYIINSFETETGTCSIITFNGAEAIIEGEDDINRIVSRICDRYYSMTPSINNELINKRLISSSPIKKARKAIIEYILDGNSDESFYNGTNPEATIFRAVMKNTGILSGVPDTVINTVLNEITTFIDDCEECKKDFTQIIQTLISAPYGIRMGVIPIYLAHMLSVRDDDIVIYLGKKEEEMTSDTILNLCERPQEYFLYVERGTKEKEVYLDELQRLFEVGLIYKKRGARLNHITFAMQRWFKALPQITRSFKVGNNLNDRNLPIDAIIKYKSMIQRADINPYELVLKNIPSLFGKEGDLKSVIREIETVKQLLENYLDIEIIETLKRTKNIFGGNETDDAASLLDAWYTDQSQMSKDGLFSNQVSGLMNYISSLNTYDDNVVIKKMAKIVTDIHIENWNDNSIVEFTEELQKIKNEVENIHDEELSKPAKNKLLFVDSNSKEVIRYYDNVSENVGYLLRNTISEALDEFGETISINDKIAVLVEMLEKVLK